MLRWIWIIWVTICCLSYCDHKHAPVALGQELEYLLVLGGEGESLTHKQAREGLPEDSTTTYTVQKGDTLASIATMYRTTWEKLWEINRDRIADPNLIYIGQVLRTTGKAVPLPPSMTREEKVDKLSRFMFKKAGLPYGVKDTLELEIRKHHDSITFCDVGRMDDQRELVKTLYTKTRQYEIWILSEAIVDLAASDDEFYKLVGLAWQESHFVNQLGKHKEVSFFQFLPSTVRSRLELDEIGLVNALWTLRNDPRIATAMALDMLRDYRWNWKYWNNGLDYEYHLNNKIFWFKSEWKKK